MNLFATVDTLQEYISVTESTALEAIAPNELTAFEKYMKPYISQEFFDAAVAQYAGSPNANWTAIIKKLQRPLAYFMMLEWIPDGSLTITNGMISVYRNEKFQPASDNKLEALKAKWLSNGYSSLETCLQYLETNVAQTEVLLWKTNAYNKYSELFIKSAVDFNNYVTISGRRTYSAMYAIMRRYEENDIKAMLGSDLYTTLKNAMKHNGTMTSALTDLLAKIKPCIALLTISKSLSELSIKESESGITLADTSLDGTSLKPAEIERINMLKAMYTTDAANAMKELSDFLYDNAADYTDYTKPDDKVTPIVNTYDKPNFYL